MAFLAPEPSREGESISHTVTGCNPSGFGRG
jgi:hypothetical protein